MKAKRQRHQAAFKAKVGLEALSGIKTVAEIAREYQVHPTQVSQWKRAIVDRLPEVFEHGAGELTVDLDYLKKKSRQLGL